MNATANSITNRGCPTDCDRTYTSGHIGGWSSDHNGYCKHGTFVGGSGIDWICGPCEDGDDSADSTEGIGS